MRLAEKDHPIHYSALSIQETDLPSSVKSLLTRWNLASADGAVVAEHPVDGLVGWFRFMRHGQNHIEAVGTWVAVGHRHKGLAVKMWNVALAAERKDISISVCVYSRGGGVLVDNLRTTHAKAKWIVYGDHAINPSSSPRRRKQKR